MPQFTARHYVPILTWKQAEQAALQATPPQSKSKLTPVLQLVPIPLDLDDGTPTRTPNEHIDPAINRIAPAWGTATEFFLDPGDVALEQLTSGIDGALHAYQLAAGLQLKFVPVTGIYRAATDQAAALAHRQRGICLRLMTDDLNRTTVIQDLTAFLAAHHLVPGDVDLLVDLESVAAMPSFALTSTTTALLQQLPTIAAWRTVTVAGCSFPDLTGVHGQQLFDRKEWLSWAGLYANRAAMARMPTFGDYAIQSPEPLEGYDPRFMPMTPAIRYTVNSHWLVIRGHSSKTHGLAAQFPQLANQLLASGHFLGAGHCPGCADANACATGHAGYGAPAVWRRIGTAHHLVLVSSQVAALPWP
jgi:hypothetical protein